MEQITDIAYRPICIGSNDYRYRYIGFADKGYIGRYFISADTDMPTLLTYISRELLWPLKPLRPLNKPLKLLRLLGPLRPLRPLRPIKPLRPLGPLRLLPRRIAHCHVPHDHLELAALAAVVALVALAASVALAAIAAPVAIAAIAAPAALAAKEVPWIKLDAEQMNKLKDHPYLA